MFVSSLTVSFTFFIYQKPHLLLPVMFHLLQSIHMPWTLDPVQDRCSSFLLLLPLYSPSFLPQVPCLEPHVIFLSDSFYLPEVCYELLEDLDAQISHCLQHYFSPTFWWFPYTCQWSLHYLVLSILWNTSSNLRCPSHGSSFTLLFLLP